MEANIGPKPFKSCWERHQGKQRKEVPSRHTTKKRRMLFLKGVVFHFRLKD